MLGSSGAGAEPHGTAVKVWELLSIGIDGALHLIQTHPSIFWGE